MKNKVTIRDVAKECGYSIFTVSSVLNNRGNISATTSEKVLESARRLNYSVLKNVSAIQRMRTRSVGIVLPNSGCLNVAFYTRAISTFRELATSQDFDCKLFTEADIFSRLEKEHTNGGQSLACKGLIIYCPSPNYVKYIDKLLDENIAVALIRRRYPERQGLAQLVDDDHSESTRLLKYLHEDRQCTHFVYLNGRSCDSIKNARDIAFEDFVTTNPTVHQHLTLYEQVFPDNANGERLRKFLTQATATGKRTAVVCWTDIEAALASGVVKELGFNVPDQVCVTGYNDDIHASMVYPRITTMAIPIEAMIREACHYLFNYIDDGELPKSQVIPYGHQLVLRESTEPRQTSAP